MTPSVTGVPLELQELPQAVLDAIHTACAGDWRRVEVRGPGEWLVHNTPQMRRIQLPDVRPTRYRGARRSGGVAARPLPPEASVDAQMATLDPMQVARHLAREFANGIAAVIDIALADYILNVDSHLVTAGLSACRTPDRVEVDPSTADKGVRLRFHRGDVVAVVAFNNPAQPYLLAAKTETALRSA